MKQNTLYGTTLEFLDRFNLSAGGVYSCTDRVFQRSTSVNGRVINGRILDQVKKEKKGRSPKVRIVRKSHI